MSRCIANCYESRKVKMSYNFKWREELYIWKIKYVYNKMTASDIFHQIMSSRLSVIIFKYFGAETEYTKAYAFNHSRLKK